MLFLHLKVENAEKYVFVWKNLVRIKKMYGIEDKANAFNHTMR